MKNKYLILIIVLITFITSCDKNNDEKETNNPITFVNIGKSALYGGGTEGISASNLVITNNNDWQNLITQMNSVNNVSDNFAEIDIDFNEYMLIALILDVKGNGWEVEISEIIETETEITVSKQETESVTLVITQPFHIVKIPKNDKSVVFQ
tara:strand:- start:98 stop:553 length:456 start_codon:yes stop_codon:yes gene_type:complete